MIYKKFLILLIIALLPLFTLPYTVPTSGSKRCEHGKAAADAVKDVAKHITDFVNAIPRPEAIQGVAGVVAEVLLRDDVIRILSYIGPVGGIVAACLSVGKVALEKQAEEKLQNAIFQLHNKLNSMKVQIDSSVDKILAHIDENHFQTHVTIPAKDVMARYMEFMNSRQMDNREKLRNSCIKHMPASIFSTMTLLMEKNSDHILKNHQYTDQALAEYWGIYANLFLELSPVHYACEALINDNEDEQNEGAVDKLLDRQNKIVGPFLRIAELITQINATRTEKVWALMPNKLQSWYDEYKKHENDTRTIRRGYIKQEVEKLNSDYFQLGYDYALGVVNNSKKNYHFSCSKKSCHIKEGTDLDFWVLRTLPCHNTKKNMVTRASTCLQFQMLLYSRFSYTNAFDIKDPKAVTEMFKRNCRIKNLIGFLSYDDNAAISMGYGRNADILPDNPNRVRYKIKTEMEHKQIRWKDFDEMYFWADCKNENRQPFNFIREYCTAHSAWPSCRLTEKAFQYHQLSNAVPPYHSKPMLYKPYQDQWGHKSLKTRVKEIFNKVKSVF